MTTSRENQELVRLQVYNCRRQYSSVDTTVVALGKQAYET